MAMITRCPSCGTTFRVTPEQLQAQRGLVRCGRCAHVFDGFKTLAAMTDEATPTPMPAARVARPAVFGTPPAEPVPEVAPAAAPAPQLVLAASGTLVAESFRAAADSPEAAASATPDTVALRAMAAPAAAPPAPPFVPFEEPSRVIRPATARPRRALWAVGVVLLTMLLGAQAVYHYRSELAAHVPELRPLLSDLCRPLNCVVALPQRPRSISIEASDMQAVDPARPGLIALTATLRNHATTALGYPALDVVLTNTRDHTVARRVFLPAEYLDATRDPRAGISPNAEFTVKLTIDSGDLGAAGFRLDLLPAPAR